MRIKVWPMLLVRVQVQDGKWYPQSDLVTLLFTLQPAVQESNMRHSPLESDGAAFGFLEPHDIDGRMGAGDGSLTE